MLLRQHPIFLFRDFVLFVVLASAPIGVTFVLQLVKPTLLTGPISLPIVAVGGAIYYLAIWLFFFSTVRCLVLFHAFVLCLHSAFRKFSAASPHLQYFWPLPSYPLIDLSDFINLVTFFFTGLLKPSRGAWFGEKRRKPTDPPYLFTSPKKTSTGRRDRKVEVCTGKVLTSK